MSVDQLFAQARANRDYDGAIQAIPYARLIGLTCIPIGRSLAFKLPTNEHNIGTRRCRHCTVG